MTFKPNEDDPLDAEAGQVWRQLADRINRMDARLHNLERFLEPGGSEESIRPVFAFGEAKLDIAAEPDAVTRPQRATRPPLPDPRLVRKIIRQRQMRNRLFGASLFSDPVWDMLLDLTAARAEHKRVSVTSLCIASGVPPTTALRWLGVMSEEGLIDRSDDVIDRRRAFISLSDKAADAMASYFAAIEAMPRN